MNIYDISKTRIKAILRKYDSKTKDNYDAHDLFNWCREYEDWINTNIYGWMTSEMDYILNKSFEDNNTPYSYDDVAQLKTDSITEEQVRERLEQSETDQDVIDEIISEKYDKYQDVVCELADEIEIYEYWHVSDALAYHLEQASEIVLDRKYWARTCTGQSTKLDYVMMQIFIKLLRERK